MEEGLPMAVVLSTHNRVTLQINSSNSSHRRLAKCSGPITTSDHNAIPMTEGLLSVVVSFPDKTTMYFQLKMLMEGLQSALVS
jgi:hypothetical protein